MAKVTRFPSGEALLEAVEKRSTPFVASFNLPKPGDYSLSDWRLPSDNVTGLPRQGISTASETRIVMHRAVTNVSPINYTPKDLLQQKIRELADKGMSTRAIAGVLQAEGVNISHMTVARWLQGVLIE